MTTVNGYEIKPRANLSGANLRGADLSDANLSDADLRGAGLRDANLSGVTGLLDQFEWLNKNFEYDPDTLGFIVFKRVGKDKTQYEIPDHWKIEQGAVLTEVVNPARTSDCACGVNFATREWCNTSYTDADLWRCRLELPGIATLVVPYNTDGKARTGHLRLLEVVRDS